MRKFSPTGPRRTFIESGEPIVLVGDADGNAARLVKAVARLADAPLGPHVLIGGLAVMCRLAAVHRATQDVDTVTETTTPTAVEVIASSIGLPDPSNPSRVVVDGVTTDITDTAYLNEEDLDDIGPEGRLFLVSHRWALETGTDAELVASGFAASVRVATPPALVAMKAGALAGSRHREPRKRASDLYDLYRLVLEFDRTGGIAGGLVTAPFRLGHLVGEALRVQVVDGAERAVRWLLDGGTEMGSVRSTDLLDVLGPLVGRLA